MSYVPKGIQNTSLINYKKLDELRAKFIAAREQEARDALKDRCVVCHVNLVCPEYGEDTCHWCLKSI